MFQKERLKCGLGLVICVIAFITGEVLLNAMYVVENQWLSHTISIILGCSVITMSLLAVYFLIRHWLFLDKKEKRRKNTHIVFLDEKQKV